MLQLRGRYGIRTHDTKLYIDLANQCFKPLSQPGLLHELKKFI